MENLFERYPRGFIKFIIVQKLKKNPKGIDERELISWLRDKYKIYERKNFNKHLTDLKRLKIITWENDKLKLRKDFIIALDTISEGYPDFVLNVDIRKLNKNELNALEIALWNLPHSSGSTL